MTAPRSIDAYLDCEQHFLRASDSANGIAITVATPGMAIQLRGKMNSYRELLRRNARRAFPEDDPRHGRSPYDGFKLTIDPNNDCRVLIKLHRIETVAVEELPEGE